MSRSNRGTNVRMFAALCFVLALLNATPATCQSGRGSDSTRPDAKRIRLTADKAEREATGKRAAADTAVARYRTQLGALRKLEAKANSRVVLADSMDRARERLADSVPRSADTAMVRRLQKADSATLKIRSEVDSLNHYLRALTDSIQELRLTAGELSRAARTATNDALRLREAELEMWSIAHDSVLGGRPVTIKEPDADARRSNGSDTSVVAARPDAATFSASRLRALATWIGAGALAVLAVVFVRRWRAYKPVSANAIDFGDLTITLGNAQRSAASEPRCSLRFSDLRNRRLLLRSGVVGVVGETTVRGDASSAAIDAFVQAFRPRKRNAEGTNGALARGFAAAHDAVLLGQQARGDLARVSLAAVVVGSAGLSWIAVGAIRIYLVRDGNASQVNVSTRLDGTPMGLLGDVLQPRPDSSIRPIKLIPGDHVVVCTEVIHKDLDDRMIARLVTQRMGGVSELLLSEARVRAGARVDGAAIDIGVTSAGLPDSARRDADTADSMDGHTSSPRMEPARTTSPIW